MLAKSLGSPDVTFVVPCFKSRETISRTLHCIFSQETEASLEVIVVDSSQDSTSEWIDSSFPRAQVISSKVRLSPGAARNVGVGQARGRYLAFLDADTAPAADWLERLLGRLRAAPNVRVVGGAVEIGNPGSIPARILHWIEFSEFVKGTPSGFRSHLSSSNLLIRKEDFREAGGFDESFAMAEDLLLSQSFPGELFFESATSVDHYYRSNWPQAVSHLRKLGFWSGRLRSLADASGSWLKWVPVASLGLPPVRTILIVWRLWRRNPAAGLRAFLHSPLILAALFHWALGFYRGLREGPDRK